MSSHVHGAVHSQRFPYYATGLYVGLVTALVVADRLARWSGVDPIRLVAALLICIPFCLAGARALEVAVSWRHFRARPREIWRLSNGGAAMYGALPPLLLLSMPLARWVGTSFGWFWDVALVAILAGMIPTRLGCLGAGCCAGRPTSSPLGLFLRNAHGVRARRFPSPLFEALLGAALLSSSLWAWGRLPFSGAMALGVCAAYGVGRFVLEELREEHARRFAALGAFQWMSAALVVLGAGGLTAGWAGSHAARTFDVAIADATPGMWHLLVSSLLLLPVVRVFRFLGCFTKPEFQGVKRLLQMIVIVPDVGTGPATVKMKFEYEPSMTEADESPVDLAPAGTETDGRLRFQALEELYEATYTVTCTVDRADAFTRIGSCSGDLNAPNLVVQFNAANGAAPTELNARFCFEPL